MLQDPLGTQQEYSSKEAIDLVHDLEQYSHFEEPFDRLNLLSGDPVPQRFVESQIINIVAPESFHGTMY